MQPFRVHLSLGRGRSPVLLLRTSDLVRAGATLRAGAAALVGAAVSVVACTSDGPNDSACEATLVVGVQGQPGLAGVVAAYRTSVTVDGAVQRAVYSATGPDPIFPKELSLKATGAGKRLDLRVDAYNTPTVTAEPQGGEPAPVLTRILNAPFVCGQTRLVRVRLEAQCLVAGYPGAFGPSCTAPQSCVSGRCIDGTLLADDLEPYAENWAQDSADACKPPGGGTPEVILGTGQTDFHSLTPGPMKPEKGPQGGHHLWIAVRMKNLKQSGSTTTITGVQPDTGLKVPVTSFVFTFDRDEGGYCKLFGLRYQLDNAEAPVEKFLGKPLDVTVEVRDQQGVTAKATARIDVADSVVVPAGL